jgi:hypothetical protein
VFGQVSTTLDGLNRCIDDALERIEAGDMQTHRRVEDLTTTFDQRIDSRLWQQTWVLLGGAAAIVAAAVAVLEWVV